MFKSSLFLLIFALTSQALATTIKSGETIDVLEKNSALIAIGTAEKPKYTPLSSLETEYAMMAQPSKNSTIVTLPRQSRNVGQGVFWYGPRTSIADFNQDGIDDVITVGVTAKKNQPKYKSGGACADAKWQGRISDESLKRKGCSADGIKMKPRISFGKANGSYEPASDDMFVHPAPKGKKVAGFTHANRAHVADFNGDGIPDIMVSDTSFGFDGDYQSLYLSNEDGTWVYSTFSNVKKVKPVFAHGSAVGDIDSDGDIDVVLTIKGKGLNCMYNDGFGNFIQKKCYNGNIAYTVSLGDIDRDGDLDAYIGANSYKGKGGLGQYGGGFFILKNNGKGKFSTQQRLPQVDCWVTNPHSIPADVDGDGDIDFVASFTQENYAYTAIQYIINEGNFKFSQKMFVITSEDDFPQYYQDMYSFGNGAKDECGMYIGKGEKKKKYLQEGHPLNAFIEMLYFGDADGDGDMDIVLSSITGGTGNWDDRLKAKVLGGWIENQDGKFFIRLYTHPKAKGYVRRLKY